MSLRLRVLLALVLVLLTSSAVGAGLAGWRARQTLREELAAAMSGGRQAVLRSYEDLPRSDHAPRDLTQLIATFDGNRHLKARLVDAGGRVVARSQPAVSRPAPDWFATLFAEKIAPIRLVSPVPGYTAVVLEADLAPDIAALWSQFQALVLGLAAVLVVGASLAWLMVGRALRPVADLTAAFERIGSGDYRAMPKTHGAAEVARLGEAVNQMAERLAAIQGRNRALEAQVLTLQDEERADLARDLHDEIGPHLFAVNVDAAMAGRLIQDGKPGEAREQVKAIQAAVAHMQRLVRDILGRLRPTQLVEMGLVAAIEDLVAFWRARRPEITFEARLAVDEAELAEAAREALYRMVQEGLANAVRHGRPARIDVEAEAVDAAWIVARVSDDGAASESSGEGGYGLIGMRERIEQAGGRLAIEQTGKGWRVTAMLPRSLEGARAA
ncbi:MAG TPA: histidine kinase [Caulobacteraceae bacterium]|jgi:two-component system sensor histidine kinase UhpB|nr:histidine kinase [Caulobacteraceae bacterium]